MGFLSKLLGRNKKKRTPLLPSPEVEGGLDPGSVDTMAAIKELSQVVRNNPDAVEIYLALGNLYRSQGDIERAILIRSSLIVRPGLDTKFTARALFELGRDYKRGGFMDRAMSAFEQAHQLWGDNQHIIGELARLAAETGDYEHAAKQYEQLGQPVAQAHYLDRLALKAFAGNDAAAGDKWLNKALKVYPGSVEAWLTRITQTAAAEDWESLQNMLRDAMKAVPDNLRFVILEGLANPNTRVSAGPLEITLAALGAHHNASGELSDPTEKEKAVCDAVLPVIEETKPDLLSLYYGAWLLIRRRELDQAKQWLEKTLVLKTDFWPARLELLGLSLLEDPVSPVLRVQLEFFLNQTRMVKRFICRSCGLKREAVFFVCPRCQSWHSIAFRTLLHD